MLSRAKELAIAAVAMAAMAAPASAANGQGPNNGQPSVSTDIANTSNAGSIPEATTMILLGTGLLAAFRARREPASRDPLTTTAPTPDRRSTRRIVSRRPR